MQSHVTVNSVLVCVCGNCVRVYIFTFSKTVIPYPMTPMQVNFNLPKAETINTQFPYQELIDLSVSRCMHTARYSICVQ